MSTRTFSIQPGTQQDIPHLAEIERASDQLFPAGRLTSESIYPAEDFRKAIDQGILLVASIAAQQVGFAVALPDASNLHLCLLAVHPEHGRQGIGRALVQQVLQQATINHYQQVTLTTFADIPWNAPFYRTMGFVELPPAQATAQVQQTLQAEIDTGMSQRLAMAIEL